MDKKLRCLDCRRVLAIRKGDLVELKCPRCGAVHVYDPATGQLRKVRGGAK